MPGAAPGGHGYDDDTGGGRASGRHAVSTLWDPSV